MKGSLWMKNDPFGICPVMTCYSVCLSSSEAVCTLSLGVTQNNNHLKVTDQPEILMHLLQGRWQGPPTPRRRAGDPLQTDADLLWTKLRSTLSEQLLSLKHFLHLIESVSTALTHNLQKLCFSGRSLSVVLHYTESFVVFIILCGKISPTRTSPQSAIPFI